MNESDGFTYSIFSPVVAQLAHLVLLIFQLNSGEGLFCFNGMKQSFIFQGYHIGAS